MEENTRKRTFMSAAVLLLLSFSGGFTDAYTYLLRGQMFATMQTGNLLLLLWRIVQGEGTFWYYLIPIGAFFLGALVSGILRYRAEGRMRTGWKKYILLAEFLIVFAVGWIPETSNFFAANALVSFMAALQLNTFQSFGRFPSVTTMCTGNLRACSDSLAAAMVKKDAGFLRSAGGFLFLIVGFMLGAGAGFASSLSAGIRAIWILMGAYAVAFVLLLIADRLTEKEK